jgi:alkanesulfonate monooxygenase SsuD/methylene tetrahydromethanopterin reductase-like flavin-dependent oxidoreductase (luciferase family)
VGWAENDGVRFGIVVPQGWRDDLRGRDFERMVAVARAAERLGFDSIWLYDHLQTRDGDPEPMLECWTSLAALARETSRVRLGQLVTCALYRNAGLLGQMAATVDAASGGRIVLGVGAGWDEDEYRAFGYGATFPTIAERLRHLEETVRVLRRRFDGPILVGGEGERVLLRLVARYADACNLTDSLEPAYYRHKLEVLRRHCEELHRDYDSILRTASFTVSADVRRDLFDQLAGAGISYFILYLDPPTDIIALERLAAELFSEPLSGLS